MCFYIKISKYKKYCFYIFVSEKCKYAMRSSATAEDLPMISFAGQQDTYIYYTKGVIKMGEVTMCQSCGLPFNKEHAHFIAEEI